MACAQSRGQIRQAQAARRLNRDWEGCKVVRMLRAYDQTTTRDCLFDTDASLDDQAPITIRRGRRSPLPLRAPLGLASKDAIAVG
jgi:hypothetical protein